MGSMTSRERFFALIAGQSADRPAVINPVSVATTEAINELKLDFAKVHTNADNMAALAAYEYDEIGFDCIAPYFSIVAETAAMGAKIDWGNNSSYPKQHGTVFSEPEQIVIPQQYFDQPTTKSLIEAIKKLKAKYSGKALIIGKVMGPWTLCLHTYGVENTLIATIEEREKLAAMTKALLEFGKAFAAAQFEAGADVVTVADHTTRNLVGPDVYRDFILPLHQEFNKMFPGKLILHCCGNTEDRVHYFSSANFPLYHFESANDIMKIINAANNMPLTGCVNNPTTLYAGSPDDVYKETEKILKAGINILSPECAIPLSVKNENLKAIVSCAKNYKFS
ncbi:MAG: methyltransferase [Spirochaetaceae bacterium]|nr:methyltransferase [Spirochaetaceae bacterium]